MKREIKFRIWHNSLQEMLYNFTLPMAGEGKNLNSAFELLSMPIMQFTGLKDIKNVDIYEGDVLLWKGNDNKKTDKLSKVVFEDGAFSVKGITWAAFWWLGEVNDSYEIIGNIYENPELL